MTMLKSFDLKGQKQSFANWISNLSPCETPFISMIPKEKIDQVQYSWQTDALAQPSNTGVQEGAAAVVAARPATKVVTNFTQIYRKAVRVSDTTKKVSLYGRSDELAYQMEKAGMEIKRDLEAALLTSVEEGRPGTASAHGIAAGVQKLIAAKALADADTGAVVHKSVTFADNAPKFTQVQVFDLTYQLYLAGARANKVMVHPSNMHFFSDWIGNNVVTPHVHRMFDGMETKFNSHVSTLRDPLGQVFEIIPNRYMSKNQLFFFNEKDWTQTVLREPTKVELAKNGSSEKHMIEMEVGLRHRNPFASGILEFNLTAKSFVAGIEADPAVIKADGTATSTVTVHISDKDGAVDQATDTPTVTAVTVNDDGSSAAATVSTATAAVAGKATVTVKHNKAARVKVKAAVEGTDASVAVDTYDVRG